MRTALPTFEIARGPDALRAARALRRAVFVDGAGAGPGAEADAYDAAACHLVLRDRARPDLPAVGALRLRDGCAYTAREFDLSGLRATGLRLGEVGRTCLHPDYRGGVPALRLFKAMLDEALARGLDCIVGTASFPGTDPVPHLPAIAALEAWAATPRARRPVARGPQAVAVPACSGPADLRAVPPLIKSYLRAGATVGSGAWIDHDFGTVDVCIVLELGQLRLPDRLASRVS